MTPKRASLPGADELFRSTKQAKEQVDEPRETQVSKAPNLQVASDPKRPRHEEKVTFYCTPDELVRLEQARVALRADHRMSADRGRIVRAALTEILEDFEARGPSSALVRRLEQPRT